MISVCIFSAAWRRFAVTKLALTQRQHLIAELAARGVQATSLIVADDENLDIARGLGCDTIELPNHPLGLKCATGLHAAAERADYVVWTGSDDWLHPDLFDPLLDQHDGPRAKIYSGRSVAVVNLESGVMQAITMKGANGCVPWIIDSRLLEPRKKLDLIKPKLTHGLDGALIRGIRLRRVPFEIQIDDPHPFRCVDFKTVDNLTPYHGITKHLGVEEEHRPAWGELARWYPQQLVDLAQATHLGIAENGARRHEGGGRMSPKLISPAGESVTASVNGAVDLVENHGYRYADDAPAVEESEVIDLDKMNGPALDKLASELGINGWNAKAKVADKRLTIKAHQEAAENEEESEVIDLDTLSDEDLAAAVLEHKPEADADEVAAAIAEDRDQVIADLRATLTAPSENE